jgi:hypothetical protein
MAKKIKFESFKYRLLVAARELAIEFNYIDDRSWLSFIENLDFNYEDNTVNICWNYPIPGNRTFSLRDIKFYVRGDRLKEISQKNPRIQDEDIDSIKQFNASYFKALITDIASSVGYATK